MTVKIYAREDGFPKLIDESEISPDLRGYATADALADLADSTADSLAQKADASALADYAKTTEVKTSLSEYLPLAGGTLSGALEVSAATEAEGQVNLSSGSYKTFLRNDGSNFYILGSDAGGTTWNDARPLRIENGTGDLYIHSQKMKVGGTTIKSASGQYTIYLSRTILGQLTGATLSYNCSNCSNSCDCCDA